MGIYIARGVVAISEGAVDRPSRFTYVAEVSSDWYRWDGAHKAAQFASAAEAMTAAAQCIGPWFNAPDPDTVEAVSV